MVSTAKDKNARDIITKLKHNNCSTLARIEKLEFLKTQLPEMTENELRKLSFQLIKNLIQAKETMVNIRIDNISLIRKSDLLDRKLTVLKKGNTYCTTFRYLSRMEKKIKKNEKAV